MPLLSAASAPSSILACSCIVRMSSSRDCRHFSNSSILAGGCVSMTVCEGRSAAEWLQLMERTHLVLMCLHWGLVCVLDVLVGVLAQDGSCRQTIWPNEAGHIVHSSSICRLGCSCNTRMPAVCACTSHVLLDCKCDSEACTTDHEPCQPAF